MDFSLEQQNKANEPFDDVESLRRTLTTYAYNILGVTDEAEDVVQDAFVKYISLATNEVLNKRSYLIRMVINLAINRKKRMKIILKNYPGEWLPEPVATELADEKLNKREILSYSLMVLLEKLNAKQRAVFILKEAFDYEHAEIAEILAISEENSRQLLSRSKKQLNISKSPIKNSDENVFNRFLSVIQLGDTDKLKELLNDDIRIISDGGGKARASVNPVHGKNDAAAMLLGVYKKFDSKLQMHFVTVNHLPALAYYEEKILITCKIRVFENNQLTNVFIIRNPEKLRFMDKLI